MLGEDAPFYFDFWDVEPSWQSGIRMSWRFWWRCSYQYPVREHAAVFPPYKETHMPVRGLKTVRIHALILCAFHFRFHFVELSCRAWFSTFSTGRIRPISKTVKNGTNYIAESVSITW